MADRLEDRIREFLAKHLDLLEAGLSLVEKEYRLPNPLGAGGKIDLVAKDPFGHIVIIEIKRSDQAARHALNEVHKYTALFRTLHGLDETRVRVMVASTEWHELLVPFSEYAATAAYSVVGFSIAALADGTVSHAEKISLAPRGTPLAFSRAQAIYLFSNEANRDEEMPELAKAVEHSWIADYSLFTCNYTGDTPSVIYPYGIYLAFISPVTYLGTDDLAAAQRQINWEDGLDLPDENFVCAVNEAFVGNCESFEIGYPEKLVTISADWDVKVAIRGGRLEKNQSLLNDDEVLKMAKSVEGGSPVYFSKLSSPRFAAAWKELRTNIDPVLLGNLQWAKIVPLFLAEVEAEAKDASVSVSIYSPFNFLMTLFYLGSDDLSKCAHLEIAIDHVSVRVTRILLSVLAWNGDITKDPPGEMMKRIYGSFDDWASKAHFHETHEEEDKAMAAHGFSTPLIELTFLDGGPPKFQQLTVTDGKLIRTPFLPERHKDVSDFIHANRAYLDSLQRYLRERVAGI
jgi:hypothetical protein